MAFVSITRLRLRSAWQLPRFFWHAIRSNAQARRAAGNLGVEVLNDARRAFWTKTLWKDEASMRAYMLNGSHRKAMPALLDMCDEAAVAHWEQDSTVLPSWQEAYRRMIEAGRRSKVRRPSPDHEAFKIPPPRVGRVMAGD